MKVPNLKILINNFQKDRFNLLILLLSLIPIYKLCEFIYKIVSFPYQNELREGAPLVVFPLISQGGDPYSFSNLPVFNDAYGIVYNFLTVPFVSVFGNDVNTYRFFSLLCYIGIIGLVYLALKKLKLNKLLILLAILTYVSCTLSMDFALTIRPDGLGLLLFLGSIIIPYYLDFSKPSIFFALLLSLLAFYTKIYYGFGIFYLAVYIFTFKSKLKGGVIGLSGAAILGISVLIIRKVSDLYFAITYSANANVGGISYDYVIYQFKAFLNYNWPLLLIGAILCIYGVYIFRRKFNIGRLAKELRLKLNFLQLSKPLLNLNLSPFSLSLAISIVLIYFRLGRGTGTFLTYFFQLISPFLILSIFELFKIVDFPKKMFKVLIILLLFFGLLVNLKRIDELRSDTNFHKIEDLLTKDSKVLANPAIASILVSKGIHVVDSGQTEYFEYSSYSNQAIQTKAKAYRDTITENIKNKYYDFVIIYIEGSAFAKNDYISEYYKIDDTILLAMPWADGQGQGWDLNVWVPK